MKGPQNSPNTLGYSRRSALKNIGLGMLASTWPAVLSSNNRQVINTDSSDWSKTPIYYRSATEIARTIREQEISSLEVTKAYLERIDQVNPVLNAVVQLTADAAVAQAKQADELLKQGKLLGPLHGVPMTIKDSFDTAGIVSTGGTLGRKNFIPEKDAIIVRRLKEAGAILMGKTNTPELTLFGDTHNLVYGQTSNPYNLERSAGGSSGGAAAIIAAGGAPFDIGTDTGGSIRGPAHCCGLCGIKPTSGRVPRTGHIISYDDYTQSLTTAGPLARYVDDLITILPVIAGSDHVDPYIYNLPIGDPKQVDISTLRFAYYTDNGIQTPAQDIIQSVQSVAEELAQSGYSIKEARPNAVEQTLDLFFQVVMADRAYRVNKVLELSGTKQISSYLDWAKETVDFDQKVISPKEFGQVFENWSLFRSNMASFFSDYDIIICPTYSVAAPVQSISFEELNLCFLSYTSTYNLTGWPVAVVRIGTSSEGLPLGAQIVGKPWQEHQVLAVAKMFEDLFGGFKPPDI
jgi:amidase